MIDPKNFPVMRSLAGGDLSRRDLLAGGPHQYDENREGAGVGKLRGEPFLEIGLHESSRL